MTIPTGAILPWFLVTFLWLAYQYYVVNPDRRLLNVRFVLMAGAIALTLLYLMASPHTGIFPLIFLLLGLAWLAAAAVLQRLMPPPRY